MSWVTNPAWLSDSGNCSWHVLISILKSEFNFVVGQRYSVFPDLFHSQHIRHTVSVPFPAAQNSKGAENGRPTDRTLYGVCEYQTHAGLLSLPFEENHHYLYHGKHGSTNKEEAVEFCGKQNILLTGARYPPLPLPSHVLAI